MTADVASQLTRLMERGDGFGVRALLQPLDEAGRRALRPAVKEFGARVRAGEFDSWDEESQAQRLARMGTETRSQLEPAVAAFADDLPWEVTAQSEPVALAAAVLSDRAPDWIASLTDSLGTRAQQDPPLHALIDAVLRACDLPRSRTPEMLRWTLHRSGPGGRLLTAAQIRDDPELLALYPEMIVAGIAYFDTEALIAQSLELTTAGVVSRSALLQRLLDALIATQPAWVAKRLNSFVVALELTDDEIAADLRSWIAVLAAPAPAAAAQALSLLRRLDKTRPLEPDTVAEAAEILLTRPQSGTASQALTWLRQVSMRDPAAYDVLSAAAALGAEHDHRQVRAKAAALVADLGGEIPVEPPAFEPGEVLVAPLAAPPPPVRDLDELVEQIVHCLRAGAYADGPLTQERLLDAVARLVGADRRGFDDRIARLDPPEGWRNAPALRALDPRGRFRRLLETPYDHLRPPDDTPFAARAAELGPALARPRQLLARPDSTTGHVDPDRVLHTLRDYAEHDVTALPADLAQSVLRLPRVPLGPHWERSLTALATPDAIRLRDLTASPLPEPYFWGRDLDTWVGTRHAPPVLGSWELPSLRVVSATLVDTLVDGGRLGQGRAWWWTAGADSFAATPSHREAAAAAMLSAYSQFEEHRDDGAPVAMLGRLDGPVGYATGTLLGLACAAEGREVGRGAADALLALAHRRVPLPADDIGRQWGSWLADDRMKVGRFASVLSEVGAAGAAGLAAQLGLGMLTTALPAHQSRSGMSELLGTVADAVTTQGSAGADEPVDRRLLQAVLRAIADRGRSSQLVTQAARLRDLLDQR